MALEAGEDSLGPWKVLGRSKFWKVHKTIAEICAINKLKNRIKNKAQKIYSNLSMNFNGGFRNPETKKTEQRL